ncbi:MAG: anthranilate phosphoribosyltransferase, partial [Dehalococcoidia bacterium]
MMIKEAIGLVASGVSLTAAQAEQVMHEIMSGEATPAQLGAFLTALKIKGETVDEITGFARTMRDNALSVKTDGPVLDIVGTGGDGSGTMNISTCAAFIAAAAGLTVAKHGNRAMSSKCGSADVLEYLGVKIDLDAGQVEECLREVGISFMFAQVFHPAMKYAAAPRREIG